MHLSLIFISLPNLMLNSPFEKKVVIGKKKRSSPQTASSTVGMMALIDEPQYAGEWPQICMIRSEEDNTVVVHWYGGSKSSTGKPCERAVPGGRGRKEDWVETFPSSYIITSFKLTTSENTPKHVEEIIDTYHDIYL